MRPRTAVIAFSVLFCFILGNRAQALELYSFVKPGCQVQTGLIIDVDADKIRLLQTDGRMVELSGNGIEYILVFNILDNPIRQLDLTGELRGFARQVEVRGDTQYSFTGWPIRFLEELIVFYDSDGKTHLVDIERIHGFDVADNLPYAVKPIGQFKDYRFGFGSNLPECTAQTNNEAGQIQPTRIISDQIKISKFLSVYHQGFVKLDRFQKRTLFYARPYLFDRKTKVGIVVQQDDYREELPSVFPVNFQWPTGSNFGPQGILEVGSTVNSFLPNVEPIFGTTFSGKYHFLSVYFSGNAMAFPSGEKYVIKQRNQFKDYFEKEGPDEILVLPQYNQMALTGLEWGAYSFAGGYYYPIICLQGNGIFREIVTEQSVPIVSFSYTNPKLKMQFLGAQIKFQSSNPSDDFIDLIYASEMSQDVSITSASEEMVSSMESYDLKADFFRINVDYEMDEDIRFGISEVFFLGDYQESFPDSEFDLTYRMAITSVRVQQEFGDYVALKGYLNYYMRQFHSKTNEDNDDTTSNDFSFAVVVEFIL